MGGVREENQRLKMYLDRIMKDYKTLQMQFYGIVQQEAKKSTTTSEAISKINHQETDQETELISLRLGRFSSANCSKKDENKNKASSHDHNNGKETSTSDHHPVEQGLALGLDCKFEPSKSSRANEQGPLSNPSPS